MVKIPVSLQPKGVAARAPTVSQQRKIKKYGSVEGYKQYTKAVTQAAATKKEVEAEMKSLGLDSIKSQADYAAKYSKASAETKKYLDTPEQLSTRIQEGKREVGVQSLERLNVEIQKTKARIENYKRQRQEAINKNDSRSKDRSESRIDRYTDELRNLQQQSGRASSGEYNVGDLIHFAKEKAAGSAARRTVPKTKDIVIIEGQGFSVAPELQEKFIREMKAIPKPKPQITSPSKFLETIKPVEAKDVFKPAEKGLVIPDIPTTYDYGQGTMITKIPTPPKPKPSDKFEESSFYFGGKEWRATIQPQFGTIIDSGFVNVKPWERVDVSIVPIRADYSTGLKARVTEFIPVAGTPLTQLNEPVYLTSSADSEKLQKLIESSLPGAAKKIRIFLRDQQVILKKDLGRYNVLQIKAGTEEGLTEKEYNESIRLRAKINQGQQGTLGDVMYTATEEAAKAGETVDILGVDVSPRTARRGVIGGRAAYSVLTDVLMFQVAGAAAVGTLGATTTGAKLLGVVGKVAKPLRYAIAPTGIGLGGLSGYQEYQKHKDIGDAVAAGIGAGLGFFGGVYSKQIVGGTGRVISKTAGKVSRFLDLEPYGRGRTFGMGYSAPLEQIPKGYSNAQITAAEKYASKKGISIKEALKRLFGKGSAASITKRVKVVEIMDFIETATPKQLQNYVKAAIKNISNAKLSPAEKIKQLKLFFKLFEKAKTIVMIESATGLQWEIFDNTGVRVASGAYGAQTSGQHIMITKYGEVGARNVFSGPSTVVDATTRSTDLKTGLELGAKAGHITGAQASDIASADLAAVSGLVDVQTAQVATSVFTGVASMYGVKEKDAFAIATASYYGLDSFVRQKEREAQVFTAATGQIPGFDYGQPQEIRTIQPEQGVFIGAQTLIEPPTTVPGLPGQRPKPPRDKPGKPPAGQPTELRIIGIDFGGRRAKPVETMQPFYGEVMVGGKYKRVTTKPHTKGGAFDAIARVIDNTISAQGRVVPMKKKPKKGTKLQGGDGYYDRNKNKFRGFKMYKGKQVPVKNTIIEKKNRRIDTPGEKRRMGVAQFMSKGKLGRPKKKAPFRL